MKRAHVAAVGCQNGLYSLLCHNFAKRVCAKVYAHLQCLRSYQVTHMNLQSHVHTQAHTEWLCNRLSPFHPLEKKKKKSQESLECEMLKMSCIQIISRAQQIPCAVCLFCLFGSCILADWALAVMTMHCQAHGCREGKTGLAALAKAAMTLNPL